MNDRSKTFSFVAFAAALLGGLFAALSTLDFIAHLDREVHALHCSFIPGMSSEGGLGEAGCRAVMNSRYSSFMRNDYWGGIPVALLALAVFAYLAFVTADMYLSGRARRKSDAGYLLTASLLPLGMSIIFFFIAMTEVKALCKLCVGVYFSSGVFFAAALLLYRNAEQGELDHSAGKRRVIYFIEGVAFVVISVLLYVALVPDYRDKVAGCGGLSKPEDKQKVLLTLASGSGTQTALEVLDPLCPACKQFSSRVEGDQLLHGMQVNVLLFPLDSECNWMLTQPLHPGACMVSRALICSEKDFAAMWQYVMDNQESFRITATKAPDEVKNNLIAKFPKIASCLDQNDTKIRLNHMLRYAVNNRMPLTTPQLYLGTKKLCEEDSDLGLNYAVAVLRASEGDHHGL